MNTFKPLPFRSKQDGNIHIYWVGGGESEKCVQIIWKSPMEKDDKGKTRCPTGQMYLRLWKDNEMINLSQSIKSLVGSGDVPILFGINVSLDELCLYDEWKITEFMFKLKGNLSVLEKSLLSEFKKNR